MWVIRLPAGIEKRLERLAKRTGRTKAFYVRAAIAQHLEDLEDIQLADHTLRRIRERKEHTIPLQEVLKRHSLKS
jgi:RHH-type rel operon transcriptional repressor/antitoxin RelB